MTDGPDVPGEWDPSGQAEPPAALLRRAISHVEQLLQRLERPGAPVENGGRRRRELGRSGHRHGRHGWRAAWAAPSRPSPMDDSGAIEPVLNNPVRRISSAAQAEALRVSLNAHEKANRLLAEASAIRAQSASEGEQILVEARELADRMQSEASEEAALYVSRAREDAESLVSQAAAEMQRVRDARSRSPSGCAARRAPRPQRQLESAADRGGRSAAPRGRRDEADSTVAQQPRRGEARRPATQRRPTPTPCLPKPRQLRDSVQQEADRLLAASSEEAQRLRDAAERDAERMRSDAENQARVDREAADAAIREVLDGGHRRRRADPRAGSRAGAGRGRAAHRGAGPGGRRRRAYRTRRREGPGVRDARLRQRLGGRGADVHARPDRGARPTRWAPSTARPDHSTRSWAGCAMSRTTTGVADPGPAGRHIRGDRARTLRTPASWPSRDDSAVPSPPRRVAGADGRAGIRPRREPRRPGDVSADGEGGDAAEAAGDDARRPLGSAVRCVAQVARIEAVTDPDMRLRRCRRDVPYRAATAARTRPPTTTTTSGPSGRRRRRTGRSSGGCWTVRFARCCPPRRTAPSTSPAAPAGCSPNSSPACQRRSASTSRPTCWRSLASGARVHADLPRRHADRTSRSISAAPIDVVTSFRFFLNAEPAFAPRGARVDPREPVACRGG